MTLGRALAASMVIASAFTAAARADEQRYFAVVKSQDLEPYAVAVAAFSAGAQLPLVEYDLKGDEARARKAFEAMRRRRPALVWALGPMAATFARRELPDVPLLFSLVPNHEKYDLAGDQVTGIALSRGLRGQLELLRTVLPKNSIACVFHDPRASGPVVDQAAQVARELGVTLQPVAVAEPGELDARLRELPAKAGGIFVVPDRTVANVAVFEKLLAFSRERRVPIVGLGEEQVRAGALVGLSPNVAALGRQAARVAQRIADGASPRSIPVAEPETIDLAINASAVRALSPGGTLALDLLDFAARGGHAVKTFQTTP